jgi:hypothetical protein
VRAEAEHTPPEIEQKLRHWMQKAEYCVSGMNKKRAADSILLRDNPKLSRCVVSTVTMNECQRPLGGDSNHCHIWGGRVQSGYGDAGYLLDHPISSRDVRYNQQLYEDDWTVSQQTTPNQEGQEKRTHGND